MIGLKQDGGADLLGEKHMWPSTQPPPLLPLCHWFKPSDTRVEVHWTLCIAVWNERLTGASGCFIKGKTVTSDKPAMKKGRTFNGKLKTGSNSHRLVSTGTSPRYRDGVMCEVLIIQWNASNELEWVLGICLGRINWKGGNGVLEFCKSELVRLDGNSKLPFISAFWP